MVKDKLLNSLRKNDEVEETEINIENLINNGEAIGLISSYEGIIKTPQKKVTVYITKQGQILKKFKL